MPVCAAGVGRIGGLCDTATTIGRRGLIRFEVITSKLEHESPILYDSQYATYRMGLYVFNKSQIPRLWRYACDYATLPNSSL